MYYMCDLRMVAYISSILLAFLCEVNKAQIAGIICTQYSKANLPIQREYMYCYSTVILL